MKARVCNMWGVVDKALGGRLFKRQSSRPYMRVGALSISHYRDVEEFVSNTQQR